MGKRPALNLGSKKSVQYSVDKERLKSKIDARLV